MADQAFRVEALFEYEATEDNQLSLEVRALIDAETTSDATWWYGTLVGVTPPKSGWFPASYVRKVEAIGHSSIQADAQEKDRRVSLSENNAFSLDQIPSEVRRAQDMHAPALPPRQLSDGQVVYNASPGQFVSETSMRRGTGRKVSLVDTSPEGNITALIDNVGSLDQQTGLISTHAATLAAWMATQPDAPMDALTGITDALNEVRSAHNTALRVLKHVLKELDSRGDGDGDEEELTFTEVKVDDRDSTDRDSYDRESHDRESYGQVGGDSGEMKVETMDVDEMPAERGRGLTGFVAARGRGLTTQELEKSNRVIQMLKNKQHSLRNLEEAKASLAKQDSSSSLPHLTHPKGHTAAESGTDSSNAAKANEFKASMARAIPLDFAEVRTGMGAIFGKGKLKTAAELMTFQSEALKQPLLRSNIGSDEQCIDMFKAVQCYMGDRQTRKDRTEIAFRLLSRAMTFSLSLKDELYLYLCKQTNGNPKKDNVLQGWGLMHLCLASFPPSDSVTKYVMQYIESQETLYSISDAKLKAACSRALLCLPKIRRIGARKELMSSGEYEALLEGKNIVLNVKLPDGSEEIMEVEPYARVADLILGLKTRLNLKQSKPFALFQRQTIDDTEASTYSLHAKQSAEQARKAAKNQKKGSRAEPDPEECFVTGVKDVLITSSRARVVDVVARWEHRNVNRRSRPKPMPAIQFQFVYRARLVLQGDHPIVKEDREALNLMYMQVRDDFMHGRFNVEAKQSNQLSALMLIADYSKYSNQMMGWVLKNLQQVVPAKQLKYKAKRKASTAEIEKAHQEQRRRVVESVLHEWEELRDAGLLDSEVAKLAYLEFLDENWEYGAEIFYVMQRIFKFGAQERVKMAINCHGVRILDPDNDEVMADLLYSELVTWGVHGDRLIFVVGSLEKQKKIVLKTTVPSDGVVINLLLKDYAKIQANGLSRPIERPAGTFSALLDDMVQASDDDHGVRGSIVSNATDMSPMGAPMSPPPLQQLNSGSSITPSVRNPLAKMNSTSALSATSSSAYSPR